jgi:hypothetical protein
MGTGTYGGFSFQPEQYGGGRRRIEYILDALLQSSQDEIGLNIAPGGLGNVPSNVWLEDAATARGIDSAWSTNVRGSNEFDPRRTQAMLPRWEAIFGIVPPRGATPAQRRAAVTFAFQALGKSPTPGQITDDLTYLGTTLDGASTVFVGITNTSSAVGPLIYPGFNGVSVGSVRITASGSGYGAPPSVTFTAPPGGDQATGTAVLTGGAVTSVTITHAGSGYVVVPTVTFGSGAAAGTAYMANPNWYDPNSTTTPGVSLVDWWSAVLNVAVQVTQPAGMSGTTFHDLVSAMGAYLDGALPAWCTFDFYQLAHPGFPFNTEGFYLDEPNLSVESFRV